MYTFQDLYEMCQKITSDDSSTNLQFFKDMINGTNKYICALFNWSYTEKTLTRTSTATQESIILPVDCLKVKNYYITSGTTNYPPISEIADTQTWDVLTSQTTNVTGDVPQFFHIEGGVLLNYPKISTAGLTITIRYLGSQKKLSQDDYTTGTITAATINDETVTGDSTVWTSAMAGRYIEMPDGYWYEIDSVTDNTHLELVKKYQGATFTGGSNTYVIGECPVIPEAFQDLLWYRPVAHYMRIKGDEAKASYYSSNDRRNPGLFESGITEMRRIFGSQTTQTVLQDIGQIQFYSKNDYPTLS